MKSSLHSHSYNSTNSQLPSFSTAVSRDYINCYSAGLGSSLYRLGADPTENTVSIVIYSTIPRWLLIRLPSLQSRFLAMNVYSSFQASCHIPKSAKDFRSDKFRNDMRFEVSTAAAVQGVVFGTAVPYKKSENLCAVQVQYIAAGPRQHSHSWFRNPLGPMTKLSFVLRPFIRLDMGSPLRREEGLVFLSRRHICCPVIQHECTRTHTASR
jgi:hypothetical protein